jgi:hypothetical protein
MRFGLQRSLIFWAGVLMTVFIGWAARDSRRYGSGVIVGDYGLGNAGGGVLVQRNHGFASRPWETVRNPAPVMREVLEGPFFLRGEDKPMPPDFLPQPTWTFHDLYENVMSFQERKDWALFFPYWLLWMVMGVVWVVLLVWRQRRGRGHLNLGDDG